MLKKLGAGMLIVATIVSPFNARSVTNVYATPVTCATIAECRENLREARENIAGIVVQEEALSIEIADIQADIDDLREQISVLRDIVRGLEAEISELSDEISDLMEEMEENAEKLRETEERIETLIEEIASRMRITQRVNNRNSILSLLSEAESMMDFIRTARTLSQIAAEDADFMNELTELMEFHAELSLILEAQYIILEENRDILRAYVLEQEAEEARIDGIQSELTTRQHDLLRRMYELGLNRENEEERVAALEAAEEILRQTPPPPVVTPTNPPSNNNNTASGGGSSSSGGSSSGGSSSSTPAPPPAQSTGLAHPLPGASVTSEFGPRWGGWHGGIDVEIFSQPSAPILAAASGTVTLAEFHSSMGWYVIISHNINGQRVDTVYAHLRHQPMVSPGDVVSQGQQIGNKGATGFVTGAHLHFEVHEGPFSWNNGVNPRNWINF